MARIRTIKPEFWASEQVMACSREARLLFIGLWNFADDAGRMTNSAGRIKAQVFPGDTDLDLATIHRWLAELSSNELIRQYEVAGSFYLEITGWFHQRIDRPRPSRLPAPASPGVAEASTNDRRALGDGAYLSNPSRSYVPDGPTKLGSIASPSLTEITKQKGWTK